MSMQADASDMLSGCEVPVQQPRELLERQRRAFLRLRWVLRIGLGCLLILILTVLTVAIINGELQGRWYLLPLPVALVALLWGIDRARFCPDCSAQYGLPVWKPMPAYCPNCRRLLDPARVLLDPPGTLDLNKEKYLKDAEPVLKLIAMVILLGVKDRSTEIRFEPGPEGFRLRYRCDGDMYEMVPPPLHLSTAICGTLKAMACLRSELTPQTGTLQIKVGNVQIDGRVETQPKDLGEDVILWLRDYDDARST